jgi:2'-5' RNA ligase
MRLFLAIELGLPLLEALDAAIAPLRLAAPELAWVPREKQHLTLKFFGDVDGDAAAARIAEAMEQVASAHRPIEMELRQIGAFPNFRRARVVWIGVENEPRLELLHHDLEIACEHAGFEVEGRPFRPHITVARVRSALSSDRAREVARVARSVRWSAVEQVDRISLMESTLAPAGARYRRVHAATLRGR